VIGNGMYGIQQRYHEEVDSTIPFRVQGTEDNIQRHSTINIHK